MTDRNDSPPIGFRDRWGLWFLEDFFLTYPGYRSFPGVYVLQTETGRTIYVGQSWNVKSRILCHLRRFQFHQFKTIYLEDEAQRRWLERKLLYRIRPVRNGVLPTTLHGNPGYVYSFDGAKR